MENPTDPTIKLTTKPSLPRPRIDLKQTFAALSHPNYRLWFYGQMVSLVGTWMQSTAQGYLIYQLTKSDAYLGYVGFLGGIPSWLLTLYGGVIADRMPRRNLLVITQTSMMILAFILAGLTFGGVVQPWHILILAFLLGIANAFDAPARLAFVPELVDRENLLNAIALNAIMFNTATAVGPAVAGLAYARFGPAWCFILNGVSFVAVIAALILMKLKPWVSIKSQTSAIRDMLTGFNYVRNYSIVAILIAGLGMVSLFGLSFATLLPAWAVEMLGGNATTLGQLQSARGIGALIAGFMIASLGRFQWKGKLLTIGTFIFPTLIIVFSLIHWLPLAMFSLVFLGWSFMLVVNLTNALVQTQAPDNLRGRVMSVYSFIFFGFMPLGALLAGQAADRFGEQITVLVSAIILLCYAVFIYVKIPSFRRLK